tara:strand:+ start:120 stop:260 length:141 start_codon:yes stop_codon:yes gene_type:complete
VRENPKKILEEGIQSAYAESPYWGVGNLELSMTEMGNIPEQRQMQK